MIDIIRAINEDGRKALYVNGDKKIDGVKITARDVFNTIKSRSGTINDIKNIKVNVEYFPQSLEDLKEKNNG